MEEQLRQIVSSFTGIPAGELQPATCIDRTAVASSIVLHRMYAQLSKEGFTVSDHTQVHTFGDLLQAAASVPAGQTDFSLPAKGAEPADSTAGIDLELVSHLPRVTDFRQEPFYTDNFSPSEIAYCILQPDAYASFAGLFAAKEALVKADNRFRSIPFHTLTIEHLPGGKPVFPGFQLSISHAGDYAVALAIPEPPAVTQPAQLQLPPPAPASWLAPLALIISLISLSLLLFKGC